MSSPTYQQKEVTTRKRKKKKSILTSGEILAGKNEIQPYQYFA